MANRQVIRTRKNGEEIIALCGIGWPTTSKDEAIRQINKCINRYYVNDLDRRVEVRVVDGDDGPYLRTDWDDTTHNNLLDLPDC